MRRPKKRPRNPVEAMDALLWVMDHATEIDEEAAAGMLAEAAAVLKRAVPRQEPAGPSLQERLDNLRRQVAELERGAALRRRAE